MPKRSPATLAAEAVPRKKPPILAVTLALAAVFAVVVVVISLGGGRVEWVYGQATLQGGALCPCKQAVFYFVPGADIDDATRAVFAVIRRIEGVGNAVAHQNPPSLVVNFCGSNIQEPAIREAIERTGFIVPAQVGAPAQRVAPGPSTAPTAPVALE